jgi:hypothetical protein
MNNIISDAIETVFRLGKESAEKDRAIAELRAQAKDVETWKLDATRRLDKSQTLYSQSLEAQAEMKRLVCDLEKEVATMMRANANKDELIQSQRDIIAKRDATIEELNEWIKTQGEAIVRAKDETQAHYLASINKDKVLKKLRDALKQIKDDQDFTAVGDIATEALKVTV